MCVYTYTYVYIHIYTYTHVHNLSFYIGWSDTSSEESFFILLLFPSPSLVFCLKFFLNPVLSCPFFSVLK